MNAAAHRGRISLRGLVAGAVSGLCSGLACGLAWLVALGGAAQPGAMLALACGWGMLGGGFLGGLAGLLSEARGWTARRAVALAAAAPVLAVLALFLAAVPFLPG